MIVMTETSKYLSILAKVMRNKSLSDEDIHNANYDKLYYLIHTELTDKLRKSMYPYTSDIIQRIEGMLDAMEPLYLCNEIIGKKCLWVSSYITTNIFEICGSFMENKEFSFLFKKIYTQIPIVVVDTNGADYIEVVNYANVRIMLSASEFRFLVIESGRRKIALNKVVQFIIVHTKMKDSELCIISDNIYSHAEKLFARALSGKLVYLDEEGINTIEKRKIGANSFLLLSDKNYSDTVNNPKVSKYTRVKISEIEDYVSGHVKPVLYGFWEDFSSIEMQIIGYYESQLKQSKIVLQEVIGDIVRIGDSNDSTLKSIRIFEESREKNLKEEKNHLNKILKSIDEIILKICAELGENFVTDKIISKDVFDNMFSAMFCCKTFSSGMGKKIISKLYTYEYDNYDLVNAYVQSSKGANVQFDAIDIEMKDWEKAKMLLNILNPDEIKEEQLREYVNALGKKCNTGRELYAKALTEPESERQYLLQDSLMKGYMAAGDRLIDMYKKGWRGVNLKTLANSLVPEACMILAEENMNKYRGRRRFADLADREFTYYKIAAASQYAPAIGKIVDIVFESRFSSGFQIPADDINDEKYEEMIENGHAISMLCHYLISKLYNQNHYQEILGIVLFSLNEDLSGAMNFLSNPKTALGLYCKGNMYEFGGGVAIDLDEAIKNYKKSIKIQSSPRAEKRLAACQGKQARFEDEEESNEYYREDRSYHSTSTYRSSSTVDDGCFAPNTRILMADGTYRDVENVKVNDEVVVFDHYSGNICFETIVANAHENTCEKVFDIIKLTFEDDSILSLVKSHALFDADENRYVWLTTDNVSHYVGHSFVCIKEGIITTKQLIKYDVVRDNTRYYMPISKYHLNLFAEDILSMPPTKMTVNMFGYKKYMTYDTDSVQACGCTQYEDIKSLVTQEEFENLPCKYLKAICKINNLSLDDFMEAICLYREQDKYRNIL